MKKTIFFILLSCFLISSYAQVTYTEDEDDLTDNEIRAKEFWDGYKGTLYGLYDNNNNEIFAPVYEWIAPVDSATVYASLDGKCGIMTLTGETVVPFVYDHMNVYNKDYIVVKKGDLWGVINIEHKIVVPMKYGGIKIINGEEKLLMVKDINKSKNKKKKKWRLVDIKGKKKSREQYDNIKEVYKNGVEVVSNYKRGVIDSLGKPIVPTLFDKLYMHRHSIIVCKDSLYGAYDYNGRNIVPVEYTYLHSGYDENDENTLFSVEKNKKWGLVNDRNEVLIPFEYESMGYFNGGISDVGIKGYKYAVINSKGELITPFDFGYIFTFYNGIAATDRGSRKYGVIDTEGNEVIPFIYHSTSVATGDENLIEVYLDGKYGMVNRNNEVVIPIEYDFIYSFGSDEVTTAGKNGKHGLIDKRGNVILPFRFDIIMTYYNSLHVAGIKPETPN